MATIKDIARLSGYSIGTVSRVINNKADVSQEARQRIEHVIRDLNFQPNSNARQLKNSSPSGITVIVRGMNNSFLVSILEELQFRMREHRENVSVQFLDETEDEVSTAIQLLSTAKPKGFIFLGGSTESFRNSFEEITVPCVLVTGDASSLGYENLSSFTTDDFSASAFALNKLIELGHREIGIIGGYPVPYPEDNSTRRIDGALSTIKDAGLDFDRAADYEPCPFSMQDGYDAAERLLRRRPSITGIFAVSDTVAFGAMRYLADSGRSVPGDVSVIGYDGIDGTSFSHPRLSTVRQNVEELASRSVDDLLLRINYERPAVHAYIPFSYVTGESVAPPKQI